MLGSILGSVTWKQSQITVISTIVNGTLGALFYIVLARFLGPADFGLLTVSVAFLTLTADIVDFGTNTGIVRFVSSSLVSNHDQALKFLKLSLEIKLLVWILVLIAGTMFAPVIADKVFNKTELAMPLRLVMIGVGGALLFSFATASLQSFQKYFAWSFVNIFTNFLRLVFIFLLFFNQGLNLTSGLLVYLLLPFFGFSLALLFIPVKKIFRVKDEFGIAGQMISYNFWVAMFTIIAALSSRLDTFLIARLLSSGEIGVYGAANQLVQVVPQMVGALGVVAAPKFASFTTKSQMIKYFKKFQLMVLGLAVTGSLVLLVASFIIPFIYGGQYKEAVSPFIILFLAMLVFLISVPVHNSIIYYFGKPQIFVWVSIGHILIISSLGYVLISNYGVIGAAISVLIGMLFNFLVPLIWFLSKTVQSSENKE